MRGNAKLTFCLCNHWKCSIMVVFKTRWANISENILKQNQFFNTKAFITENQGWVYIRQRLTDFLTKISFFSNTSISTILVQLTKYM